MKKSKEFEMCENLFIALAGVNHKIENKKFFDKKYKKNHENYFIKFVDKCIEDAKNEQNKKYGE